MNIHYKFRLAATALTLALAGGGVAAPTGSSAAGSAAARPAHSGPTMPAALRPVFYQALAKDVGSTYRLDRHGCAVLPKQGLKACFDARGAHFTGATPLSLHLVAWGRGNELANVTSVQPKINGNRVNYKHDNLTVWWRVLPVGFEQGFTIAERPTGHGKLTLALQSDTPSPLKGEGWGEGEQTLPIAARWTPHPHLLPQGEKGQDENEVGWGKLRYGQLVVTDAKGRVLPATLTRKGGRVLIAINDIHAAYPLTVDPLVWIEQSLVTNNGTADSGFGLSVALDGTTVLIGADGATVNGHAQQGAAYVFSKANGTWSETAKLTASDGAASDEFGNSVALVGSTALVGAYAAIVKGHSNEGAVYVFTQSGDSWTQTQKLTASDGAAGDEFGISVALSGTTMLIGAWQAANSSGEVSGVAYVFTESGGTWTQHQKIDPGASAGDEFGASVALAGKYGLIGAPGTTDSGKAGQGVVYAGAENSGGVWFFNNKLSAGDQGAAGDNIGISVALSGDVATHATAVLGAWRADVSGNADQGAAWVWTASGGDWTGATEITASGGEPYDAFGSSVAISGSTIVIGAPNANPDGRENQGAAYVFTDSDGTWSQTKELVAGDGSGKNRLGISVAVAGATALAGAPNVEVGKNENQGAAYVFSAAGGSWEQSAKLTSAGGLAGDSYGNSVAISGTTAIVGADGVDESRGAAYVFTYTGGRWNWTATLHASDGVAGDFFGTSVALDAYVAAVGAPGAKNGQGQVYVFSSNNSGNTWAEDAILDASDKAAYSGFGSAVALYGDALLVGAPGADVNTNPAQGSVYLFSSLGNGWAEQHKFVAGDGAADDEFGTSAALIGNVSAAKGTVAIGANLADVGGNVDQGAVYVFSNPGGVWNSGTKLTASDGAATDYFGTSLDFGGDTDSTLLVGAPNADVDGNEYQGAAYLFDASGGSWSETAKLTASDGTAENFFGESVALGVYKAIIGSPRADIGTHTAQGAAYVFSGSGGNWNQTRKLTASDGVAGDAFGSAVALTLASSANAVIGAKGDNDFGDNPASGAAYAYGLTDLALAVSAPGSIEQGSDYTSQIIVTNNTAASSPAVIVVAPMPAGADYVSATSPSGTCSKTPTAVNCDLGTVAANGGTATAEINFTATGNVGDTIHNAANLARATPTLSASMPTIITAKTNNPPVASDGTLTTDQDTAASGMLAASDPDGDPLVFGIVDAPAHGTVNLDDASTGAYTYTPDSGYSGGDSFTFKANDGNADSNTATINITVNAAPPPPPPPPHKGGDGGGLGALGLALLALLGLGACLLRRRHAQ